MERKVKIERLNEEGKVIDMEVPLNLLSLYTNAGWKKAEKKKTIISKKGIIREPLKVAEESKEIEE